MTLYALEFINWLQIVQDVNSTSITNTITSIGTSEITTSQNNDKAQNVDIKPQKQTTTRVSQFAKVYHPINEDENEYKHNKIKEKNINGNVQENKSEINTISDEDSIGIGVKISTPQNVEIIRKQSLRRSSNIIACLKSENIEENIRRRSSALSIISSESYNSSTGLIQSIG